MSRIRAAGILLGTVACLAVRATSTTAETTLKWPLTLKPVLSSTFGETRSSAFHAGIDLKTWGKKGYPVHAVGQGYAMRLRTSPWGYGRALYQKLGDGRIVVYAHLESFAEPMASRVRAAQLEAGRFSIDLWLDDGEVALQSGQLIARTGASGTGPPHLHLELRDADNVPINPLLKTYSIGDSVAPTLRRIAFVPMDATGRVDGRHRDRTVALRWNPRARRYEYEGTVTLHGSIGVAVQVYDRADGATNKLAPLQNKLAIDGEPVLTASYRRIPYADAHQVRLDRFRLRSGAVENTYFNLFRLPGNQLPFYETKRRAQGILSCGTGPFDVGHTDALSRGPHILEVESTDAAGNTARARVSLLINAHPSLRHVRLIADDDASAPGFIESEVSDIDHARLMVTLSRSREGGDWESFHRQEIVSGTGPFTWDLKNDDGQAGARFWKLLVSDGAGSSDAVVLDAGAAAASGASAAAAHVTALDVYDESMTLSLVRESGWVEPPGVGLSHDGKPRETVALSRNGNTALLSRQISAREWDLSVHFPSLRAAFTGGSSGHPIPEAARLVITAGSPDAAIEVPINTVRVTPSSETAIPFAAGEALLKFQLDGVYAPFFPQVTTFEADATAELEPAGAGYAFAPALVSFKRPVEVSLRRGDLPTSAAKLAVYEDGGEGVWVFAGNRWNEDSTYVSATVRSFGRFAALTDQSAPQVAILEPAAGAVLERSPELLLASVRDEGSGIGREEDLVLELNRKPLIAEYDPEAHRLIHPLRRQLATGEYELLVTARDRCGNEARATANFRVR